MLLSDYLVMTDQIQVPVVFGDPKRTLSRMDPNIVQLMPMDTLHRIMAVNLNASKSTMTDMVMDLRLTDVPKNDRTQPNRYTLEVRKGILEVNPPAANNVAFTIVTDSQTWKELVLYKLAPQDAVVGGRVTISRDTPASFYSFMDLFK
jgi:alkyl sulfatase BDS1-like metallo-beta-lactamase superfamily hydrolase